VNGTEVIDILSSLRVMTTAYLFHEDTVLLMKRSSQRSFIPDVWSGIGGHVEPTEYGDIRGACLREIEEETGLQSEDLKELVMRYVILRQRKHELRQQFIYFGTTTNTKRGSTEEGTLHWIPTNRMFDCLMTDSNRLMLRHYFDSEPTNRVWVGTMYGEASEPKIHWALMSDWESL
jgi:8-oxo-dGTP diphosphatase